LWLESKFVNLIFQLFKLLVDKIHYVLVTLSRVLQIFVVLVFRHVNVVFEKERLNIAGHPQQTFALQSL
jgi:hypothetical protein